MGSYYNMDAIGSVLGRIISLMMVSTNGGGSDSSTTPFLLTIDQIKGNEMLTHDDRKKVYSMLKSMYEKSNKASDASPDGAPTTGSCSKKPEQQLKTQQTKNKNKQQPEVEQPKAGAKSGAKGKVVWKFAGHKCYGTLLPIHETKTHCYARTHKGN